MATNKLSTGRIGAAALEIGSGGATIAGGGLTITAGGITASAGGLTVVGGTGTAAAGAVTLNNKQGVITSEALTTAAGATYTLTITNSAIAAADVVLASVTTTGTGMPVITKVTPAAGSLVIVVQNIHATVAFSAAVKIAFIAITQA